MFLGIFPQLNKVEFIDAWRTISPMERSRYEEHLKVQKARTCGFYLSSLYLSSQA
jgi:hypothetical protein